MKKYIANTDVSVSVTLPNGKPARVSFTPLSEGKSVFYTSDEDIQWALEHHYKYGKLFRLVGEERTCATVTKTTKNKGPLKRSPGKKGKQPEIQPEDDLSPETTDADTNEVDNQEESGESEIREVTVSDMDDAKDYLAEHFDVVRTKLKSEESIINAGLSFGVKFKVL